MSESNFGLTGTGLRLPRSSDWLGIIRDSFEVAVQEGPIDWSRQSVLGPLSVMMAERLGSCSEMLQAVYDARSVNNANGVQLDDLAQLSLTERAEATHSEAILTLTSTTTSTTDVFVESGTLFAGGGADRRARWRSVEDATVPASGGSTTVVVEAIDEGPVAAAALDIVKILTPVEGLAACSNAAEAVLGRAIESDASMRRRIAEAPFRAGRGTVKSLVERVRALTFVVAAQVVQNDTDDPVTIGAIALPGHTKAVIVYPSTLTTAEQQELAATLFDAGVDGIRLVGTGHAEVTFGASTFDVRWNYASADPITAEVTLTLYPGVESADVIAPVEEIVTTYFAELLPGDDVERDELICRIRDNVPGVKSSAVLLAGFAADYSVLATNIATLAGPPVVTVV